MLSWEYPPLIVGGLGRHVDALSRELVAAGHEVCVVTRGGTGPLDEVHDGVRVRRSATDPIEIDFTTESLLAWTQAFEHGLVRAALPIVHRFRPDVIHAHDWLVTQTAVTLGQVTERPVVATVHATEAGRHQGWLPAPLNRAVHSVERWLVHEADRVITCSTFMRDEVARLFGVDHVQVVPNGLDADAWRAPARARLAARARYAGDGPLLVIAARLVHEKGVQVALAAMPRLRRDFPGIRLVVAGTGPLAGELRAQSRSLGDAVRWAGFVPERELAALLGGADAVLVPSLYEPFGLVALEAAAAAAPLAVADTGGLRDLDFAGARFAPDDPGALADAVTELLADRPAARRLASRAQRRVRRDYSWAAVAERTANVYAEAAGPRATAVVGS
jgi:glycogen(starch) synthase